MTTDKLSEWVQAALAGDRRGLARLLTRIESGGAQAERALALLYPHTGRAWRIGVTGVPGAGKSTLAAALTKALRARGQTVAILAVDPSSPFTGGALLGDRIRMRDLSGDSGVFVRSMATRGSLGGLANAARDAVRALDAVGFDVVMVETVGAGQNEVDISGLAHTVLVVDAPGMGDEVQAIKAGILEIADVLCVNKADRPGVEATVKALQLMVELGHPSDHAAPRWHHGRRIEAASSPSSEKMAALWVPPIVRTVATNGQGVSDLLAALDQHRAYLQDGDAQTRLELRQLEGELIARTRDALLARLLARLPADSISHLAAQVQARQIDPTAAARALIDKADDAGVS